MTKVRASIAPWNSVGKLYTGGLLGFLSAFFGLDCYRSCNHAILYRDLRTYFEVSIHFGRGITSQFPSILAFLYGDHIVRQR